MSGPNGSSPVEEPDYIAAERADWLDAVNAGRVAEEPGPFDPRDANLGQRVDAAPWGQGNQLKASAGLPETAHPVDPNRFVTGGAFILDVPDRPTALWGSETEVGWASGEPLYITGAVGIGKTTLMQRLALGRIRVGPHTLLGYQVEAASGPVLYLASDRPDQASRSFRRMVTEDDRRLLDERLIVWRGPPAKDLAKHPEILVETIRRAGATEVYLDSLKDMALGLSDDDVGAGLNTAVQIAIAEGYEVAGAHHPRKKTQGGERPKSLDDIYGSTWITSGAGSVIHLHGEPGSLASQLIHLKAPHDNLGPFDLTLDPTTGTFTISDQVDLYALAGRAAGGITAQAAAAALFGPDPTRAQTEEARRKLKRHPRLEETTGENTTGGTPPKLYRPSPKAVTQGVTEDTAT